VTEHISRFHLGDKATHEMQVGTTDGAGGHFKNRVTPVFDLWIWNFIAANVASTVIDQSLHGMSPE
jgi:hypothetical protein